MDGKSFPSLQCPVSGHVVRAGRSGTFRALALTACAVAATSCGSSERVPAPPRPSSAPQGSANPSPSQAGSKEAVDQPTHLTLTGDAECARTSKAIAVALVLDDASLPDVLTLLSTTSSIPIRTSGIDAASVRVKCKLDNIPWDCVVTEIAKGLGARVEPGPKEFLIVRNAAEGAPSK